MSGCSILANVVSFSIYFQIDSPKDYVVTKYWIAFSFGFGIVGELFPMWRRYYTMMGFYF